MGAINSGLQARRSNLPQSPVLPAQQPTPPPAAAESYQAGGIALTLAAVDLRSESQARDRLLAPEAPALQPRFIPRKMDVPQAMGLSEFVRRHYPGLKRGQEQPYGTNASVMRSYEAHFKAVAKGRHSAIQHNNRMGIAREGLDLRRAEFNAKQAASRIGKDKFHTFEALVMDRIHAMPQEKWQDDPAFIMWSRMKGAVGKQLPSLKEQIAEQTVRAANEFRELGTNGVEAELLVLMTDPLDALKLMTAAKNPKTLKRLEEEALSKVIAGQPPKEQLETIRSGGKRRGDLLTGTKFGTEVFGELGGFGSIVKQLDKGMDGFIQVLDRFNSMVPTMNDDQREALTQIIRNKAPSLAELVNAGPKFTGRDGKTHGDGTLTEQQLNEAIEFVITPDQRRQLGP